MELIGTLHGDAQHRRTQTVEFPAARIHNQQPLLRENLRIKLLKRLGKSPSGLVGRNQSIRGFGGPKNLRRALRKRRDGLIENDPASRQGGLGR